MIAFSISSSILTGMLPAASNNRRGGIPLRVNGVLPGGANVGEAARVVVAALFFPVDDFGRPDDFAMITLLLDRKPESQLFKQAKLLTWNGTLPQNPV